MKIFLWEMSSSILSLGSMEVSRGAKDASKRISKTVYPKYYLINKKLKVLKVI